MKVIGPELPTDIKRKLWNAKSGDIIFVETATLKAPPLETSVLKGFGIRIVN